MYLGKLRAVFLALLTAVPILTGATTTAFAGSQDLVISQVYGGGGNSGATYTNDFIELHNRGSSTVSLAGWSVQYAAATGTTWSTTPLSGSIAPGAYYLVQEGSGGGGTTPLPTPEATGAIAMSATSGKVALVSVTGALSGSCPSSVNIVDKIGYGTANCFEGPNPAGVLSNTTASLRAASGCTDADNNSTDFASSAPAPRNSAASTVSCQRTLSVATAGSGSVAKSPDQASYLVGSSVQLTATASTGSHFVGWSGDAIGNTNPLNVTMDADKNITATFALDQQTLAVTVVGNGLVAKVPDQPTYDYGSSVQLTATAGTGSHFVGWSGDASGNTNPLNVTMDADKNITATFALDQQTLAVTVVGNGLVAKVPDQPTYDYGSSVQLTATASTGSHFVGWSGDASGNTNPLNVTMDADKNITATFALDQQTLAVTVVGNGLVAKVPDQPTYDYGSSVQLTATASTGSHFVGWSGDASGNTNPLNVTMDADKNITATFALDQQTLAVTVVGNGLVAKVPDQPTYDYGSSVQLTATASTGSHFVGWSGDASGNTNPLNVTMDADKSITATFALDQQTLAVTVVGNGLVAKVPDQPTYDYGSSVQLTATAATGSHFVGWSGDASGNTNPLNVTMDADKNITATFALDQQTLAVTVVGNGLVAKVPDQPTYDYGSSVQLTATAGTGSHFVGWSGDASGNTNPLDVTMDADKNITATFALDQQTLAVTVVGNGLVAKAPDQPTYDYGSSVQLTATAATGSHFVGWSGDASGNTNPLNVTMDADKSITATFALDQQTLAVTVVGNGLVAKVPDQPTYDYGSSVQLTATPAAGWHLVGWSGDASGSTNPLNVTMDADKNITATFGENTVVVSQVYGGGGNSGATLTNDFIELFNRGPDPIDLTGWTVQYAAATGTTWQTTSLSGVIQPGRYYLVQEAAGSGGTTPLPTPDATGSIAMSATSGKVALVNDAVALSGACPGAAVIEDLVGYGSANCSETSATPGLTNTTADLRSSGGCVDTDDNSADFAAGTPTPRNSATPANDCLFTLTVAVDPAATGTVAKVPDQASYSPGSLVQLTATAAAGYHFDHWSGVANNSVNPITVTMDGDKSVTAHFVSNASAGQIVISQVYGGGGNTSADYKNDFVELYNRGTAAVTVTGWTVQYASASGTVWSTVTLIGTIGVGHYYLVQEAQGVGGTLNLPAPDAIGVTNLSATDGKVALVSNNVVLSGACPSGPGIVDFVGYGSADCSETSPASGMSNPTASLRGNGGCDESDNNTVDFATGAPTPRNLATPVHICPNLVAVDPAAPSAFVLAAPYPNPTNGTSRIFFDLPSQVPVRLTVQDVMGRRIVSLVDRVMPAGRHQAEWSGRDASGRLSPGLYFVRLDVPGRHITKALAVIR